MEIILPTVGAVKRKRIKSKNKCGIKQVIKPVNTRARVFTPNAMQCAYIYTARALTKTKRLSLMAKQYLSTPKFVHHVRLASAAGLVLLFGAFIMPIAPFYHSTVASPGTSNPSTTTLTMELGHENASLTILPSGTSGTFGTSTAAETAKFDIVTDNFTGYTLSLQGTNDTRQLVNSATSTVLDSIASVTTAATFDTDPYNNKWGFLPSKYNSTTNADYIPAPTTSAVATLDTTSTANSTAIDYSLGLGARVDINKPAGDYSNTYILAATGNAIHYTLNFDQNTTDTVSNMPLAQSASTTQTKIVVDSAVPQRAHYAFTGWCLGVTSTASGTDSCYTNDGTGQPSSTPGTVFQPGDDFGIDQTTANSTTVYAMWTMDTVTVELTAGTGIDTVAITGSGVKTGGTAGATSTATIYYGGEITITATVDSSYTFKDWTSTTDTYTDNPYTISNVTGDLELTANGEAKVYIQNLAASTCTSTPTTVYDNRDGQSYTIQKLADGNCWMMTNLNLGATTLTTELNSTNTNVATAVPASTFNGWKKSSGSWSYTNAEYIPLNATNTSDGLNNDPVSDAPYGTLYNFCSLSAGTYCYANGASTDNAIYDICPAGWRLPVKNEFTNLYAQSAYNTYAKMRASVASGGAAFTLSGSFSATVPVSQGGVSSFYASDRVDGTYMSGLRVDTTTVSFNGRNRREGYSARCIMKTYMQDFTSNDATAMANGATKVLSDKRDNRNYSVTKINGEVWMTQNLRFSGTDLTTDDTNVTSNRTLTYYSLDSTDSSYAGHCELSTGYTNACIKDSGSDTTGAWYNYYSASAGSISGSSNTTATTEDICPKGWKLPTGPNTVVDTDFNKLIGNTTGGWQDPTSGLTTFNPVTTGWYSTGTLRGTDSGYWWSANAYNSENRYQLDYNSTTGKFQSVNYSYRSTTAIAIRCVYSGSSVNPTTMQDFTNSNAAAMTAGETKSLIDIRDSQAYTVAKLADGNVWMVDNLNLGANTLTTNLDDKNSNTVGIVTATTFNSWKKSSATNTLTAGEFIPVAGQDSTSKSNYGTLYNYCATSAGTICSSSNDHDAVVDICPAGWRLPTGGTNGEYQTLYSNYGTYASMLNPVANGGAAFAQPGYFSTGAPGGDTAYQTSTNYDTLKMNALSFNAGVVHADNAGTRGLGFAIRCIYDGSRKTMQDFTNADAAAMTTGESKMLVDSRDNEKYTVAKLADGNVWMTWNLRFTGTTLTPNDSNVGSNVTMSYGDLSEGNSYDQARIHTGVDNNGNSTVWYNYAAASAMSVTGSSDTTVQVYDICPKGWRLPTKEEQLGIVNYGTEYGMVSGGRWQNGASDGTTYGSWWASTLSTATDRWHMSNGSPMPTAGGNRYRGFYVRCIYNGSYQTMQNFSGANAAAMSTGETKVLVDSRDNQKYAVTKLSDGNVWMTRNLAIGCNGSTISSKNLTTSDSNLVANWTTPDSSHSLTLGDDYTDPRLECSSKYGGWYNFSAATAENIVGSSSTVEPSQDICPAGWQIPTYTQGYNILSYTSQFNPINGGNYLSGSLDPRDRGIWWLSSSTGNITPALQRRYIYANFGGNLGMGVDGNRFLGLYVRCIKKNITSISQLSTMQQFSGLSSTEKTNVLNSMTANTAYSLTDSRDEQVYQVKKINGTVWMTRNLAIGCNGTGSTYGSAPSAKTLTPADTDTASNFTTSTSSWEYSYTNPAQTCSDTYGAWYNYVSATAGTITGQINTNDAQYSICPAGWRLPNTTEISGITSYSSVFAPTTGGRYYMDNFVSGTDNGFGYTTYGIYWASTSYSSTGRWWLGNNNGSLYTNNGDYGPIDAGFYIRCVAK